ncbi:hypothetical protein FHR90_003286 [Endobacter medicaginis]|uniref:Uncharacterized protein n=1 Tax=Endobacter medicaginis TaxID=1181271 RepID=A0A839V7N5_9PROT|nr:hypothetical protein [Endobacter medicaginis]
MPFHISERLRRLRFSHRALDILLRQLTQKSTVVALLNAVVLLVGYHADPAKIDAVGLLLSLVDTVILALVQERPGPGPGCPPPPPPDDTCAPAPGDAPCP